MKFAEISRKGVGLNGRTRFIPGIIFAIFAAAIWVAPAGCRQGTDSRREYPQQSPANIEVQGAGARYDLGRDEERGGHTLARHVGLSDEQLEERLQRERSITAASTWTDRQMAEETVAEALAANREQVERWIRRGMPRANLALHYDAKRVIGRSLRRGHNRVVPCTGVVIVLRTDGPQSFYVLTTYPEASE